MIALLSQDELISLLGRNGIPIPQSSMFGDSVYLSLTKHSLLGSVAADHRDYCVAMRLDEYVEMANDCEDFSLQFVMRAKADAVNALLTRRITARAGMAVAQHRGCGMLHGRRIRMGAAVPGRAHAAGRRILGSDSH
jgi:hypothetical protein